MQAQASTRQQAYNFEGTYDNFSYGNPIMQSQESSNSYYKEQIKQPSDKELLLALKEEIKKDRDALEMWWLNMETKMVAKMIANMDTNLKNLDREMYVIMERTAIQAKELAKVLKEQSSRQLPCDIKNDFIRECENENLSLEDEHSSPTLDEDKDIMECDKMPFILEREFQVLSLVEKNEVASEEEPKFKMMQVEEKHPWMRHKC